VIGDREAGNDAVALRLRDGRRIDGVSVDQLIPHLADLVASRSADLGFR
jgi:threonyl-tRNA synthetase